MADKVFAYIALKPCGCFGSGCTPSALAYHGGESKFFKEQMDAKKIVRVMSREEWNLIPWKCGVCKPPMLPGMET